MKPWIPLLLLLNALQLSGQEVFWASAVMSVSSSYSSKEYSADQILGPPSSFPAVGRNTTCWSPRFPDAGAEFIQVKLERATPVLRLYIGENLHPGGITRITLEDTEGIAHVVYSNETPIPLSVTGRWWVVQLESVTTFKASSVRVDLNTAVISGYQQIDCIGVSPDEAVYQPQVKTAATTFYSDKENPGQAINSRYGEVHPLISPDGRTLYYTRKNHPTNYGVERKDDIWVSSLGNDQTWLPAINIGPPLNTTGHNYVNATATDGSWLLLGGTYGDYRGKDKLYLTYRRGAAWSRPEEVIIEDFYNLSQYNSFHMSGDGNVLLMALQRDDALGMKDLYISFRTGERQFTAPRHMGPVLNTAGDEVTPFLAADGKTLYFSTDGRPGYGRNDIFMSRRLDDSWDNWSTPLNMGPSINSADWDAYYSLAADGEFAWFTSYDGGLGEADIFRIRLSPEQQPDPVILLRGTVFDANSMVPVPAAIMVQDTNAIQQEATRIREQTGDYTITLTVGQPYRLTAKADGYYAVAASVDLSEVTTYEERTLDMYMYPIRKGEVIPLQELFFAANSADMLKESFPELQSVAGFLLSHPQVRIEIGGHTNNKCSNSFCRQLSSDRAEAVAKYLISQGVPSQQVTFMGYGKDRPIVSNDTEQGRQRNQRVEFTILSAD